MRTRLLFIIAIITLIHGSIRAQDLEDSGHGEGRRIDVFVDSLDYAGGRVQLGRGFIIRNSERVIFRERVLDVASYTLDYRTGELALVDSTASGLLVVTYRVFPFEFALSYQRRTPRTLESVTDTSQLVQQLEEQTELARARPADPFGRSSLQRSGSIRRGIVAGNNRDVTVESGLRMQLAGEIVDGVQVQAVLTDENTPIQPEGTTQRLNEFDRVFIEIAARQGTVQLGDFDVSYTTSEFARFSRKLQGIHAFSAVGASEQPAGAAPGLSIDVAGATARGQFRTQEIEPIDGVQGPYRLEGDNGERFIIVVAGSEVVFLDGVQMTRGETNDYVIDYATGEITFTTNRIITSDRRISVEFQYTSNQFNRSLTGASVQTHLWKDARQRARSSIGLTFLREADGDLFNDEFGLTGIDSLQIEQAGDGLAQRSGATPVEFDPEAPFVHYQREVVTNADGQRDSIFVAIDAAPPDSVDVFRVQFTRVGTRQGSYVRLGRQINGILYEYRGPREGDYEPIRVLPKPANHNVLDFNARLEPIRGVEVFGEWARSFNDQNRFSSLDSEDDVDFAYQGGIRLKDVPLSFGFEEQGLLRIELQRRQIGADFESFNRIRPVEFGRTWNLSSSAVSATGGVEGAGDERIDALEAALYLNPHMSISGEHSRIDLGDAFDAQRTSFAASGYDRVQYTIEWIASDDRIEQEEGAWIRQRGRVSYPLLRERLTPGLEFEQERREQQSAGRDSLLRGSLDFVEVRPGIQWATEWVDARFGIEWRNEQDVAEGALRDAATAWTYQGQFDLRPGMAFTTDGSVGYRVKRFTDYFRINEKRSNSESLLLRWNSQWRPLRRVIDLTTRYEASTERTPTLQEIYIRTGPELGQYVWEDTNGDGAIQIDEFLPERTPNEGTYIQTFVPSDSLSSIISVRALVRFQLDPSRIWSSEVTGLPAVLRHVTARTTFEVQEKSRDEDLAAIYLLNLRRFRDATNTLNGRLRINQNFTFFRTIPRVGIDLGFSQLRSLSELSAGEETRFLNGWNLEGRYALSRRWGLRVRGETETSRLDSETFASRRYKIQSLRIEPEVSVNWSRRISTVAGGIWARKDDRVGQREAVVWRFPFELQYRVLSRTQITARSEVAIIDLKGEAQGLAAFELTDGRGAGTSYLWGLQGNFTLNTYLRLSFAYDGRSPAGAPTIHTLRVQMSALF